MVSAGNFVAKHDNSGVTLEVGPKDLPQLDLTVSLVLLVFFFLSMIVSKGLNNYTLVVFKK